MCAFKFIDYGYRLKIIVCKIYSTSKPLIIFLYSLCHINDIFSPLYAADYILISAVCWPTLADIDRIIVYILKQRLKSSTAVKSSPALCKQNIRLRRWGQYIDNAQKSCQQTCLFWLISCSRPVPNFKSYYQAEKLELAKSEYWKIENYNLLFRR